MRVRCATGSVGLIIVGLRSPISSQFNIEKIGISTGCASPRPALRKDGGLWEEALQNCQSCKNPTLNHHPMFNAGRSIYMEINTYRVCVCVQGCAYKHTGKRAILLTQKLLFTRMTDDHGRGHDEPSAQKLYPRANHGLSSLEMTIQIPLPGRIDYKLLVKPPYVSWVPSLSRCSMCFVWKWRGGGMWSCSFRLLATQKSLPRLVSALYTQVGP